MSLREVLPKKDDEAISRLSLLRLLVVTDKKDDLSEELQGLENDRDCFTKRNFSTPEC